jgi:hypothetical protein
MKGAVREIVSGGRTTHQHRYDQQAESNLVEYFCFLSQRFVLL